MTDAQLEVPTRVGVYRPRVPTSPRPTRSPPHAWGCTVDRTPDLDGVREVPTRVGVYRRSCS